MVYFISKIIHRVLTDRLEGEARFVNPTLTWTPVTQSTLGLQSLQEPTMHSMPETQI